MASFFIVNYERGAEVQVMLEVLWGRYTYRQEMRADLVMRFYKLGFKILKFLCSPYASCPGLSGSESHVLDLTEVMIYFHFFAVGHIL